jgi:DinB superfamily
VSAFETALARLRAVQARLDEHAAAGAPPGLTEPDPGGTERWEAGQVWAHLAEFPAYWLGQIQHILERRLAGDPEPVPFGRTKTDAARIAAIERDRNEDPEALLAKVRDGISATVSNLDALPADAWSARGLHPTRGEMTPAEVLDRFIVNHLEEHADQLDKLRDG